MKIAIVQSGPVYNDLDASLERACKHIESAAENNCDLIVFGECWLSGYPVWLDVCKDINTWDNPIAKQVWAEMYNSAVDLKTNILDPLISSIKSAGLFVVIGINEKISQGKGNRSLYNSILSFNANGEIVNHHRKLMPTYTEKLVHNLGDGSGLKSVETPFGRMGSLICWEHWMPMARQVMHDSAEDIHIALWPYLKEANQLASRHYAIEGRCHVVAVGQTMLKSELPSYLEFSESIPTQDSEFLLRGGSCIYAPNGDTILEPQYDSDDLIITELDLSSNIKEMMNLSVSGHYQRLDIFDYKVNKKRIEE